MPRVNTVKRARKAQGTCGRCGATIGIGDPYRWWRFRYGGRRVRCMRATCAPRGSELTQARWGNALAAIEDAQAAVDHASSAEELEALAQDVAEAIDEVAEEYREAAEQMGGAGEQLEEWADQVEGAAEGLRDFYPDPGDQDDDDALEEAREELLDLLSEAAGEVQVG